MPVADVLTAVQDHTTRAPGFATCHDYVAGDHRYPYATPTFVEKFRWVLENARANMCDSVTANFTDRVAIQSWAGEGSEDAIDTAELAALDTVLDLAVGEAWTAGDGYVLVWPDNDGVPSPWFHRADQVAFERDPGDPGAFLWVAKLWENGLYGRVNVYYPGGIVERWETTEQVRPDDASAPTWPATADGYAPATDDEGPTVRYEGDFPWVHLPFDPDVQGGHGRSILRDVIPLQDALNHALVTSILNVEQYAAPLRALMNHQPKVLIDPATGMPTEEAVRFDETRNRLFGIRGPGPLTQLDPPDSGNILAVMDAYGAWIARVVGLPPSDLIPDLGNVPSGVSLRVLAARRTAAVRRFTRTITPAIHDLAALLGVQDAWPVWEDPAPVDDTERWEVAATRQDLGYTLDDNLNAMGVDGEERKRIVTNAAAAAVSTGAAAIAAFNAGTDPALLTAL
jgi:hypothetical protein